MGVFTIYVVVVACCCAQAARLFTMIELGTSTEVDDVNLGQIIVNISQDETYPSAGTVHQVLDL